MTAGDDQMPVARSTIAIALMLLATATAARAECAFSVHASGVASACIRTLLQPSNDRRWQTMSGLQWVDSSDWIRNPPAWLREVEESRRRRAPLPLLHLWRSQGSQTLLALGLNRRLPGLYFARKLPY
jgi:hypothetical protein